MNIEQRIKNVIASQLGTSVDKITNQALLDKELGADSLDTVEIIMAMEDEFGMQFQEQNVTIKSVQDVIDYINKTITQSAEL